MSDGYISFALKNIGYGSINETDLIVLSPRSKRKREISDALESHLLNLNISYILTVGVSGLVLCAIGSDLKFIAEHVGINTTTLGGNAFLLRGIGSIIGSAASSQIFQIFEGDHVLLCGLLGITTLLLIIPSVNSAEALYLCFFLLGWCSSINDTGCNIMTRKIRGKQAGPWLGANGISFGMSAAIVPVIELISNDFATQYYILASMISLVTLLLFYRTQQESNLNLEEHLELKRQDTFYKDFQSQSFRVIDKMAPHYYVEIIVGIMLFCLIGGQVIFVAYINSYIDQSHILPSTMASTVLSLFWCVVTIGRMLGVWDQRRLTDSLLVNHLSICCWIICFTVNDSSTKVYNCFLGWSVCLCDFIWTYCELLL